METIYLDHNATTPLDPRVGQAMATCWSTVFGNPSSQHSAGRAARRCLEEARESIAASLGARLAARPGDRVVLTSGGTEANNLAMLGLAGAEPGRVVISAIEHPSVQEPAALLARRGWEIQSAGVSHDGVVDLAHLAELVDPSTRLVSLMLASNETGVVQPIAQAAQLCAERNVPLHTDAAQVAGKLPIDFHHLGAAALSVTAHKLHGPIGIGALVIRGGIEPVPQLHGGFQQQGLRPGTEPVALAVGLARALELATSELSDRTARMRALRDRLIAGLRATWPPLEVIGEAAERLPHTANVSFVGLDRQALAVAFDLAGVACSTGSACASGAPKPSSTLLAMGLDRGVVEGALRLSLGATSTEAEVDEAVRRISRIVKELRP